MTRVTELNDALPKTLAGGRLVMTASVQALPSETVAKALSAMRSFDCFTEDNDPHQEHDFGNFEIDGYNFFFKIDYYDSTMEYGSEDPADPSKTLRVLTLMLAEDYRPTPPPVHAGFFY